MKAVGRHLLEPENGGAALLGGGVGRLHHRELVHEPLHVRQNRKLVQQDLKSHAQQKGEMKKGGGADFSRGDSRRPRGGGCALGLLTSFMYFLARRSCAFRNELKW